LRRPLPIDRIDRLFAEWDRLDSPGCALAVIRAGAVLYARGYGSANLEYGLPITPATVFVAGSVAKQFTACAIYLLAQDGLLALDDPVRAYVPDAPAYCDPVTIRHLLHHTGGLRDHWAVLRLADYPDDGVYSEADIMDLLRRQRGLVTAPGATFCYSNPGYILLSMVVRQASGRALRAFADERIFAPLGMRDTRFHDDHRRLVPRRADGHEPAEGGGWRLFMPHSDLVGNGGLLTTVEDLARWDANFYAGAVGGMGLIARLLTPGALNDGQPVLNFGHRYAGGLLLGAYRGLPIVHHPGGNTGYRAQLVRFPAQRLSVACLCNLRTMDPTALAFGVADVCLEDELGPPPASPPATPATPALALSAGQRVEAPGLYDSAEVGTTFGVTLGGGALRLRSRRGQEWGLRPLGGDEFAVDGLEGGRLTFRREGEAIAGFELSADRAARLAFDKRATAGDR